MTKDNKYHKHNYLKLLIFEELYEAYPGTLTMPEIAKRINHTTKLVDDRLASYHKYKYIGRYRGVKLGTKRKIWRYRLNILGIQTYLNIRALYKQGRELNLRKLQRGEPLERVDSYIGYSKKITDEPKEHKELKEYDIMDT